jgi:hypothetical protein
MSVLPLAFHISMNVITIMNYAGLGLIACSQVLQVLPFFMSRITSLRWFVFQGLLRYSVSLCM